MIIRENPVNPENPRPIFFFSDSLLDVDDHTRAQALNVMSSVAGIVGIDSSRLRIVPYRPDCAIADLDLPKRVQTALAKNNIQFTSQLVFAWANQTLPDFTGIGQTSMTAIIQSLINHNYITQEQT